MKQQIALSILALSLSFSSFNLNAQIDVLNKVKNKVNQRVDQKIDQTIDKGLDSLENNNRANKQEEENTSSNTQQETKSSSQASNQQSLQSYSNYDFVPGDKIIFFDDFSAVSVGDFPASWNTNASGEVVTTNLYAGNWFKMLGSGSISLNDGLNLPDNYTIEFDVISNPIDANEEHAQFGFYLYDAHNPADLSEGGAVPGKAGIKMTFGDYRCDYSAYNETGYTMNGEKESAQLKNGIKYRLSFWVQKTRLRVYLNQDKIFDLPRVFGANFKCNMARFELWNSGIPMVSNFRIAAGLPDLRSKLITEGKLVSYGIYFDVNKDVVKPESYATMKGIADVLIANPLVRIKIIGHTDSDGEDANNLDLSKRRAASVKKELIATFKIDAARIEIDGKGETQPVAANDNPMNKSKNRRVEFIKL